MPWLYDDDNPSQVSEAELREEIRSGGLSAIVEVRHPPWTGARALPIEEIEALHHDLQAPAARAAARARLGGVPWGAVALLVVAGFSLLWDVHIRYSRLLSGEWPFRIDGLSFRRIDWWVVAVVALFFLPGPLLAAWAERRYGGPVVPWVVLGVLPIILYGDSVFFGMRGDVLWVPLCAVTVGASLGAIERGRRLLHWSLQTPGERIAVAVVGLVGVSLPIVAGELKLLLMFGWWLLLPAAVAAAVPQAVTWGPRGRLTIAAVMLGLCCASFAVIPLL